MSKIALLFISIVFTLPFSGFAQGTKTIKGLITNDSPWAFSEFKVELKWIYKCGILDSFRICNQTQGQVQINENGSYEASVLTGTRGIGGQESFQLIFSLPNNMGQVVEFTDKLPRNQNLFIQFIKGTVINSQLPDGASATNWMNNVAPASQLSYQFRITDESTGKQVLWLQETFNGAPIQINDILWITTSDLRTASFRFSETADAIFHSGGKPVPNLFQRTSTGTLSQDSFAKRLGPIVLEIDKINTNLSGRWSELLLLHDLGRELGFAVANTRLEMDLTCQNETLTGTGRHFHFQNKYDTCDTSPCDEKLVDEFNIHGTCREGRGEFTHVFTLKEYLGPKTFQYPLHFKFVGVTNHFAIAYAYSEENKNVGWYRPGREPKK